MASFPESYTDPMLLTVFTVLNSFCDLESYEPSSKSFSLLERSSSSRSLTASSA